MKNNQPPLHRRSRQGGFTLIVGLIMLLLLTLMAVAAFRMGANHTVITANAQYRSEGLDAAQQVVDTVLNSADFTVNPSAAIANSNCTGGGSNTACVDVNGDGANDFKVSLTPAPTCISATPIVNSQLDISNSGDAACIIQTSQNLGVAGASQSGNSLCANSNWEINASAVDSATNTTVKVAQGVSIRIPTADIANNCP